MTNPVPTHAPKTDTPARPRKQPSGSWGGEVYLVRDVEDYVSRVESTLAAERASLAEMERNRDEVERERDAFFAALQLSEKCFNSERASRLQAETEQFNAGIEAAALLAEPDTAVRDSDEARMLWKRDWKLAYGIRSLAKPSVSPEQEKP